MNLLFDAHKDEVDELRPLIKEFMEKALTIKSSGCCGYRYWR
jgi:quinol monooxygenase YgiN